MKHLTQRWPLASGRTSWLLAAAVAIGLLALVSVFDASLSRYGRGLPAPVVDVFAIITRFGDSEWILVPALVLWLITIVFAAIIPKPVPRRALWQMAGIWAFIGLGVAIPGLLTTLIKRVVGRARPELLDTVGPLQFQWNWIDWTYQSFPSGHTTTAFATCFVVSFLSPRWFPWMLILAVLIGLSRIVVGAHYPTDLIAGAIIGTLGAYLVRNVFAARRWVFEVRPDGTTVTRPLLAVRRLAEGRRRR
jgi:membrane-associated phospholipid phosphatase